MIYSDMAFTLDPVVFARSLGIEPDEPWQADLLRSQHARTVCNMSRQVGKSTTCAILALWTALYCSGSLILLVSPSLRQSQELFLTFMNFYRLLKDQPPLPQESALRATFPNGSRVIALPGSPDSIRGFAGADLIILDEAARIEDTLIAALTPMTATKTKAKIIALSSPAAKQGFFWERWSQNNNWHKVRITAHDCPRISPEFLAEELRELGPQKYAQEYMAEFLDDDQAVFPVSIIEAAFTDEVEPLWR
jgi:hypothetical protein